MHMEQPFHSLDFVTSKWLCFLLVSMVAGVTASATPEASLLCISECGTCPVICSPPPSPPHVESKSPPSPPLVVSEPPPYLTPIHRESPPPSSSPPSPPPRSKSCPPPSYITMGTNAPPPPPKLVIVPSTQVPPGDGVGQRNYSYPYYYFYASKGAALSREFSVLLILFVSFHAIFLSIG